MEMVAKMRHMMECPNCGEIELPSPDGGECGACGIPAYFHVKEKDIGYWHWMYHHDWCVPDAWIVRTCFGFIRRVGILRA